MRSDAALQLADAIRRRRRVSLDWMASVLAGLDCDFTIRGPDELRDSVQSLAERLQTRVAANNVRS